MVDKLIRGKIIEIAVVIVFVIITIPVWQAFDKKISAANVTTMEDYNMNFDVTNLNTLDRIIVSNDYYINKNYTIYLVVNNMINQEKSNIIINNELYKLEDFYSKKEKNNYVYTLVSDYLTASSALYDIKPEINGENNNYTYIFEEKTIF